MGSQPNLFIVGAPKCGTTAISEYLRSHPDVFVSEPKEPDFFSTDLGPSLYVKSLAQYLALFDAVPESQSVVCEASTAYLRSEVAIERIASFAPEAKILVMIRRPSHLVQSFHGENTKDGEEPVLDFEAAWNLQEQRAGGQRVPRHCRSPEKLQYRKVGQIGRQLQRVFAIVPRANVHVIVFDDFCADTRETYLGLLRFLELPDDGRRDFPRVNEAKSYKWPWLGQFPKRLRAHVARPLATLRRKTSFRGTGLIKAVDKFNASRSNRHRIRPAFQKALDDIFRDEVAILEELLHRDLSSWYGESGKSVDPR